MYRREYYPEQYRDNSVYNPAAGRMVYLRTVTQYHGDERDRRYKTRPAITAPCLCRCTCLITFVFIILCLFIILAVLLAYFIGAGNNKDGNKNTTKTDVWTHTTNSMGQQTGETGSSISGSSQEPGMTPVSGQTGGSSVTPVSGQTGGSSVSPLSGQTGGSGVSPVSGQTGGSSVSPVSGQTGGSSVSPVSSPTSGSSVSPVSGPTSGSSIPTLSSQTSGSSMPTLSSQTSGSSIPTLSSQTSGSSIPTLSSQTSGSTISSVSGQTTVPIMSSGSGQTGSTLESNPSRTAVSSTAQDMTTQPIPNISVAIPDCPISKPLILHRRVDNSTAFSNRTWSEMRSGFGTESGNYWIGLEAMHQLTTSKTFTLHVDFTTTKDVQRNVTYSTFVIGDESSGYDITINGFEASFTYNAFRDLTAGAKFSTFDRQNNAGELNCDVKNYGPWWYADTCKCDACLTQPGINYKWSLGVSSLPLASHTMYLLC